ncbi:hypothetical protein RIF29_26194 [Crotalaria pallida]|uniref:Uncharacterized protein n=1 Tax=Crotalaria pallida TaxID=3830 RepID=A0AAN9I4P3_CROPI
MLGSSAECGLSIFMACFLSALHPILKHLEEILGILKEKADVGTLLLALQRTLEFEDELAEKFGGGTQNREIENKIERSYKSKFSLCYMLNY